MLLTTMTPGEITRQIHREYLKLWDTTVPRLLIEYDKERRKFKIDKTKRYPRDYQVKTHGKNNWIICISKAFGKDKYDGETSASISCAVYYYAEKGIRVFIPTDDARASVFNPHFFKRYNERLNLGFEKTVDVITHFLKHNLEIYDALLPEKNRVRVIGYCNQGILLGEMISENKWLVWKTFVNRELVRDNQQQTEHQLLAQQIKAAMAELEKENFDETYVRTIINRVTSLKDRLTTN